MTLVRWTPKPVSLFDDFNGILNSVFDENWDNSTKMSTAWSPAIDVQESGKSFFIYADLPGLSKSDIKVSIENNTLSISGKKERLKNEDNDSFHYRERNYGSFNRSFKLTKNVDDKKISAKFSDGVLSITIPKLKNALTTNKTIKIN